MSGQEILEKVSSIIDTTGLTVAEFQEYYREDIQALMSRDYSSRTLQADNDIGPYTAAVALNRRCSVPDPKPGQATEEAKIPPTCQDPYYLYIDWGRFSEGTVGLTKSKVLEIWEEALRVWYLAIGLRMRLTENRSQAHCVVDWASLSGNILAWSHLANNSCGRDKQQRYDLRNFSATRLLLLTIEHELGHLLGLNHLSGNYLMNPSIITSLTGPTETDIRRAINLGYPGPPSDPEPEPEPPGPIPTPTEIYFTGSLTAKQGDKSLGDYILVPKPRI